MVQMLESYLSMWRSYASYEAMMSNNMLWHYDIIGDLDKAWLILAMWICWLMIMSAIIYFSLYMLKDSSGVYFLEMWYFDILVCVTKSKWKKNT